MRIYKNLKEAASETKRELKEMGTEVKLETMQDKIIKDNPAYLTHELVGYSFMVLDTKDKDDILKSFGKENEKEWNEAEFKERIGKEFLNPGEAYKLRPVWEEFMHGGQFSYTYSARIGTQIDKVIECLKETPSCRNAIVSIWDREIDIDRIGGKQRVPCSLTYQFLVRNGKLNLIYSIRSNDLMTHWCNDIYQCVKLQEYVAEALGLPTGYLIQFIGSLHAYAKDLNGIF